MRRCLLTIAFFALSGALWLLWQTRYERVPGFPVLTLEDLRESAPPLPGIEWRGAGRETVMRISLPAGQRKVAAGFSLPFPGIVECLHVKFRMTAEGLARGNEEWEDGRFLIEWRSPDGTKCRKIDTVGSVRGQDVLDLRGAVVGASNGCGMPALRVEHLGHAGLCELSGMELSVVRERASWSIGCGLIIAAWAGWLYLLIRSWPGIPGWRAIAASVISLVVAMQIVVPGPWGDHRPLGSEFMLGPADHTLPLAKTTSFPAAAAAGALAPAGKVPDQGSFILHVKFALVAIRPLLHMLLLMGPALLMFCLVGRRPGLVLMVMLALGVEFAQYLFGYGFDGTDVWDLTNDAIGIGAAVAAHSLLGRRLGLRVMWRPA